MAVSKVLLEQDRYVKLVKTSNTVVTIGSLTVTTSISGVGGLDTGAIAASTFYYVYTVISGGVVRLIASTSVTSPIGFTNYRKVGAFYTDGSSNVFKAYYFGETAVKLLTAQCANTGIITAEDPGQDFISGNAVVTNTSQYLINFNAGFFSAAPICGGLLNVGSSGILILNTPASTGSVEYRTLTSTTGAATAFAFTISIAKSGVDAIQPDWSR